MTASSNGKAKTESAATSKASAASATAFVAETMKSNSQQLFTAVKQTTTMTMDAASAVLESIGKLAPSLPSVPAVPFLPTKAGIVQLINVSFDATENLLSLQRGLTTEVVERFIPAAGAR